MPTYPLINKKTGEKKELSMSMKAYDEWRAANPDWDKDWSAGTGGTISVSYTHLTLPTTPYV